MPIILSTRALPLTRGSSQRCWMTVPGYNSLKSCLYPYEKSLHLPTKFGACWSINSREEGRQSYVLHFGSYWIRYLHICKMQNTNVEEYAYAISFITMHVFIQEKFQSNSYYMCLLHMCMSCWYIYPTLQLGFHVSQTHHPLSLLGTILMQA